MDASRFRGGKGSPHVAIASFGQVHSTDSGRSRCPILIGLATLGGHGQLPSRRRWTAAARLGARGREPSSAAAARRCGRRAAALRERAAAAPAGGKHEARSHTRGSGGQGPSGSHLRRHRARRWSDVLRGVDLCRVRATGAGALPGHPLLARLRAHAGRLGNPPTRPRGRARGMAGRRATARQRRTEAPRSSRMFS